MLDKKKASKHPVWLEFHYASTIIESSAQRTDTLEGRSCPPNFVLEPGVGHPGGQSRGRWSYFKLQCGIEVCSKPGQIDGFKLALESFDVAWRGERGWILEER